MKADAQDRSLAKIGDWCDVWSNFDADACQYILAVRNPSIHTYIHTYMHTYMHTYIHTHTHDTKASEISLSVCL